LAISAVQDDNLYSDIDYASRAALPFTTTAREEPHYKRHIRRAIDITGPDVLALDLACGDGRFTRWFLELGVARVVAVDLDLPNLKRLEHLLVEDQGDRVLIVQGDAFQLPFADGAFDAVFAIGVLSTLGDAFERAVRHLYALIRPRGLLVNSEPTWEGSLLYALVRQDLDEFVEVATELTKAVDIEGDKRERYPVFEDRAVQAQLAECGFEVLETLGIPVFPSLIFGGLFRLRAYDDEAKQETVTLLESLAKRNLPVYRVIVYISRKL
jgi:SAM-dependent methyltransferase